MLHHFRTEGEGGNCTAFSLDKTFAYISQVCGVGLILKATIGVHCRFVTTAAVLSSFELLPGNHPRF